VHIPLKIATDYDTNLPPEKLKAATQNEQNDGWLIVKNRPISDLQCFTVNVGWGSMSCLSTPELSRLAKRVWIE